MPTTRRRRSRNLVFGLTPFQRAYLLNRELPEPDAEDSWWHVVEAGAHHFGRGSAYYERSAAHLWALHRDQLLPEFISAAPGRRPSIWWHSEAPRAPKGRWPGFFWDGELPLPRERLGGVGTAQFEVLNVVPRFPYGTPHPWISTEDLRTWPDLVRRGAVAVDPKDPPRFEAEAAYLKRHGLLWPGEERRLRPTDFEPEAIEFE